MFPGDANVRSQRIGVFARFALILTGRRSPFRGGSVTGQACVSVEKECEELR